LFSLQPDPDYPNQNTVPMQKKLILTNSCIRKIYYISKSATIFFLVFLGKMQCCLPLGDPSFQTEDISVLKHRAVRNCVKMSMILLFYYVKSCLFSDETGFIFEIYLLLVDHSEILVFNKALPKSFFSALKKARPVFLSTA